MAEEEYRFATKSVSTGAKGHSRRLKKGQRASGYEAGGGNEQDVEGGEKKSRNKRKIKTVEQQDNDGIIPIMAGTNTLFQAQRRGNKGIRQIRQQTALRGTLIPTPGEFHDYINSLALVDPLYNNRVNLLSEYESQIQAWLPLVLENYNILCYGIGSKADLLHRFVDECLKGEDVLMINGSEDVPRYLALIYSYSCFLILLVHHSSSNKVVKSLLDTISINLLKNSTLMNNYPTLELYANAVSDRLNRHYGRHAIDSYRIKIMDTDIVTGGHDDDDAADIIPMNDSDLRVDGDGNIVDNVDNKHCSHAVAEKALSIDVLQGEILKRNTRMSKSNSNMAGNSSINFSNTYGGRYTNALSRLYIVVHSIDGDALRSPESQRVLAIIASNPSISLLASCESVNTPLLWSDNMLGKFRWTYHHVPTYQSHHDTEQYAYYNKLKKISAQNKGAATATKKLSLITFKIIVALLSPAHRSVLNILCAAIKKNNYSGNLHFDEILTTCKSRLIVNGAADLNKLLNELIDHGVVSLTTDSSKTKVILLHISNECIDHMLAIGGR